MKLARALFAVAVAGAAFGVTAACNDETIVLGAIPKLDDAAASSRPWVTCRANEECPPNEFCSYDRIDPAPVGHCDDTPNYCEDAPIKPVCGYYSGITYFNDCYRKQAGESYKLDGECSRSVALDCDDDHPCPLGSTCELLAGGKVGQSGCGASKGHCWSIIPCPPASLDDPLRWDDCSDEPGALRCVDRCTAIQSGRPFTKAAYGCAKQDAGP